MDITELETEDEEEPVITREMEIRKMSNKEQSGEKLVCQPSTDNQKTSTDTKADNNTGGLDDCTNSNNNSPDLDIKDLDTPILTASKSATSDHCMDTEQQKVLQQKQEKTPTIILTPTTPNRSQLAGLATPLKGILKRRDGGVPTPNGKSSSSSSTTTGSASIIGSVGAKGSGYSEDDTKFNTERNTGRARSRILQSLITGSGLSSGGSESSSISSCGSTGADLRSAGGSPSKYSSRSSLGSLYGLPKPSTVSGLNGRATGQNAVGLPKPVLRGFCLDTLRGGGSNNMEDNFTPSPIEKVDGVDGGHVEDKFKWSFNNTNPKVAGKSNIFVQVNCFFSSLSDLSLTDLLSER